MPTNPYVNHTNDHGEQGLFEDLVEEYIAFNGVDVFYLPRENLSVDPLLGEPTQSTFNGIYPLEAYLPDAAQFGGQQQIMSKFGFRLDQTTEFVISKRRFDELGLNFLRPREGDLIYVGDPKASYDSFINEFFEINQVWYNEPEWQFGTRATYKLVCQTFTFSYEKFQTAVPDIDAMEQDNKNDISAGINELIASQKPTVLKSKGNPFGNF